MGAKVLSFEVGTKVTKICVVKYKQKNPKLYQTIMINTPSDCVEDGYIKDVESLASAINEALKQAKIRLTQGIFTIASSKIVNREVIIPFVKEAKIQDIIEANATDYFPIDVKEYSLSYIVMERVNTKEVKNYRLLVLAIHSNLLMTYYRLAELLKIKVLSVDYTGNSVHQIYQHEATSEITMFIHINEQNTMVNVIKKDVLELQRVIPYGYDSILNAISDHKSLNISPEDAFTASTEKVFINNNFATNDHYYAGVGETADEIQDDPKVDVTEALRYLISNLVRVVDYYGTKRKDSRIQTLCLTGKGARILGIDQLISNEVGIETKKILSFKGVSFGDWASQEMFVNEDFIAVVGASIAPIGMIPKKYMEKVAKKNDMVAVVTISSLVALTSIVLWLVSSQQLHDATKNKNRLNNEISKMDNINGVYSENLDLKNKMTALDTLDKVTTSSNEKLLPLIKELEEKLPTYAIVHSVSANETQVLINMTVDSKDSAAMTLSQLKKITMLRNIKTAGIAADKDDIGATKISFSVSADYVMPEQNSEEVK